MVEYLMNSMNREDYSTANLVLMTAELPVTLMIRILKTGVD